MFSVVPLGVALFVSLTDWDGLAPSFKLVGLSQYAAVFTDAEFVHALYVTFAVAVVATVVVNLLALPIANLLSPDTAASTIYRSLIFFPLVMSPIVVGIIWQAMLNTNGIVNAALARFGFDGFPFLAEPMPALFSVAFVTIWQTLGFTTVLYIAALRTIPKELHEAAIVDGAGPVARFVQVTVPLLAPSVTVNVVLLMIFFLRLYDYIVVMTLGGPARSTQSAAFVVVANAFNRNNYSYGSALAIVLLVIIALITIPLVTFLRSRERAY